ncbi:MAG: ATPase, partial [Firmicutes bacterium]|nr:ATPase [Bacillota bacterium]
MNQIPTGISGLDHILCGGVMPASAVLLGGPPGCGKTTLGIQFIVNGVRSKENGLIITFEQFAEQLYRDCEHFGWHLREMEKKRQLRVVLTSPEVLREHLLNPQGMVHSLITAMNVKRVLIDSVSHFHRLTRDEAELRELVFSILNSLKQRDITVALTKEISTGERSSFEEYMVDTIVSLAYETRGSRRKRTIEVLKTRGHDHLSGKFTFTFTPEGVVVFTEPAVREVKAGSDSVKLLPTGITGLDAMLHGGFPDSSTVLLCGPAGTGKTTLSLQTMYNNMVNSGSRAVLFLSEEAPE